MSGAPAHDWRSWCRSHRALLLILLAGALLRVEHLNQPLRYDEAFTFLRYADRPLGEALGNYSFANNHLFHTLLVHLSTLVGGAGVLTLRLPAFLAGLALLPLAWSVFSRMFDRATALLSVALLAGSPVLVFFSTQGRGYTLAALLVLLQIDAALRISVRPSAPRGWVQLVLSGALGLWTIPVAAYALGGVYLWLLQFPLTGGARRGLPGLARLVACGAVTILLTLLCYGAVAGYSGQGLAPITQNREALPLQWSEFRQRSADRIARTVGDWSAGLPPAAGWLLLAGLLPALVRRPVEGDPRIPLWLFVLLWAVFLVVFQRVAPYPRTWVLVAPLVCAAALNGWVLLAARRWRRALDAPPVVCAAALLLLAGHVVAWRSVDFVRECEWDAALRGARTMTEYLRGALRPGDVVIADEPLHVPLAYEFRIAGVPQRFIERRAGDARRSFVVVGARWNTLERAARRAGLPGDALPRARVVVRGTLDRLVLLELATETR